jgi:hypothetical protein
MGTATILEGQTVYAMYQDCVFNRSKGASSLTVSGIAGKPIRFDVGRLEKHREEIHSLLSQLPKEFSTREGANLREANLDRHREPWTGIPATRDQLIQLGIAIGEIELLDTHSKHPRMVVHQ